MFKKTLIVIGFLLGSFLSQAQDKYFTKSGQIVFYSTAAIEDIEAKNGSVIAVLDTKTGALQFSALMKSFEFEKALMQEHFNEDYVESHKYPKADFKGTIINNNEIDYKKPGTYTAKVKGKLTIHGVSRELQTTGTIKVEGEALKAASVFNIRASDYKISIPSVVKNKVSNHIKITVNTKLERLKN